MSEIFTARPYTFSMNTFDVSNVKGTAWYVACTLPSSAAISNHVMMIRLLYKRHFC